MEEEGDTSADEELLLPHICPSLPKNICAAASLQDHQNPPLSTTLSAEAQSDSDSPDSLFETQNDALPVRTVGRRRPPKRCWGSAPPSEPPAENKRSHNLDKTWLTEEQLKRRYQFNLEKQKKSSRKEPVFPFLEKLYKRKHLKREQSLTWEDGAIAGYFLYMEKMKSISEQGSRSGPVSPKERYVDDDDLVVPLSEPEQTEDCDIEDSNDVEVVDRQYFISNFKGKLWERSTWFASTSSNCSGHSKLDVISPDGTKSRHSNKLQARCRTKDKHKIHEGTVDDIDPGASEVEEDQNFEHRNTNCITNPLQYQNADGEAEVWYKEGDEAVIEHSTPQKRLNRARSDEIPSKKKVQNTENLKTRRLEKKEGKRQKKQKKR